jgi:hypothetical protein
VTEASPVVERLIAAVLRSVDPDKLQRELASCLDGARGPTEKSMVDTGDVLKRIVLADILDDAILAARPGDKPFPLRLFLGQIGSNLATDAGFALASGLNFYFRAQMEEEDRARVGVEVSRLYYGFAASEGAMEAELTRQVSPLLASLMSTQMKRLRLECVDHASVFDSQTHERDEGADKASSRIVRPATFLCRVSANNTVRMKARVLT